MLPMLKEYFEGKALREISAQTSVDHALTYGLPWLLHSATGMRMGEQLRMIRHQVDFLRNIVTARDIKNGRPRDIPMNDDVRESLAECAEIKHRAIMSLAVPKPNHVCGKRNEVFAQPAN